MNYLNIYNQLMMKRMKTPSTAEYTERHHVVPKCMGGDDSPDNLVVLSAKEHYVAHHLLYKHYKTTKLAHAWFMMLRCDPNQKRVFTAKQHEAATNAHRKVLSETMKGEGNHFYGKTHTDETKKKISEANKGRVKSEAEISNWVAKVASKTKSPEHRAKIGRKGMVMLQNVDTLEIVRVPKDDERVQSVDWVNPRKLTPEKKYKCDYCDIETTKSNLKRWHNENCKHKPTV
jgi:hypothetical protein